MILTMTVGAISRLALIVAVVTVILFVWLTDPGPATPGPVPAQPVPTAHL
jgi:hypothetical protein